MNFDEAFEIGCSLNYRLTILRYQIREKKNKSPSLFEVDLGKSFHVDTFRDFPFRKDVQPTLYAV